MSWRAKQGPASFRGVKFFVDVGENAGGRHLVAHEFPFSESAPFVEDMGRRGKSITVEGYVVGDEYETAKSALIAALDARGAGELVHPFFGTRRVAAKTYRVRETRADGGMATFSIEFVDTLAEPVLPTSSPATVAIVVSKVTAVKAAARAQFLATRSLVFRPEGADLPTNDFVAFNALVAGMFRVLDANPISAELRADFRRLIQGEFSTASLLGEYVVDTAAGVFDAFTTTLLAASSSLPLDPVALVLGLGSLDLGPRPTAATPRRVVEQRDYDALKTLFTRLAITGASSAILTRTWENFERAVEVRTLLTDAIDAHAETVADDAFATLTDLRSGLVDAVPGVDSDLPRLQTYTPPSVLPSLVVAHRLYGDLSLESDLVSRNRIRHPGFVPAEELEVLTDD